MSDVHDIMPVYSGNNVEVCGATLDQIALTPAWLLKMTGRDSGAQ